MPDEFVKKEVFDARMDRMEALLEKTLTEMKADNEKLRSEMNGLRSEVKEEVNGLRSEMNGLRSEVKEEVNGLRSEVKEEVNGLRSEMNGLRSEVKEEVSGLRSEIRMLDTRVDALGSRIDTVQTTVYWGFAIIAIVLAFLPTIQDWRRMFHKPAVTMEDVEKAIATALSQSPQFTARP